MPEQPAIEQAKSRTDRLAAVALSLILLVALFMRVHELGRTPAGVHYDEAANAILANEIAQGARPIFIRAYTGKEVGYFYLAAVAVRLIGHPLTAVRLTSAFIGLLSVAITYHLGPYSDFASSTYCRVCLRCSALRAARSGGRLRHSARALVNNGG